MLLADLEAGDCFEHNHSYCIILQPAFGCSFAYIQEADGFIGFLERSINVRVVSQATFIGAERLALKQKS